MKRLKWTILAAVVAVLPSQATAQTVRLKISHFLPPVHQIHGALTRWAKELEEKSGGRIKAQVFPSGQMGPPPRQYDLARRGVADVSFLFTSLNPGRFRLTEVLRVPFLFSKPGTLGDPISSAEASAITTSLAPELAREYPGVKILFIITATGGGLFFGKAAVRKPADMKGLRIRHNGRLIASQIAAWGGTPVSIAPGEITDALAKGTIDGAAFNFEAARAFRFGGVTKKVTDLKWTVGTFAIVMNLRLYRSLPADLRKIIDETTTPARARQIGALYDAAEEAGRKYMKGAGTDIIPLSAAEVKAFDDAIRPSTGKWLDSLEKDKLPARALMAKVKAMVAKAAK